MMPSRGRWTWTCVKRCLLALHILASSGFRPEDCKIKLRVCSSMATKDAQRSRTHPRLRRFRPHVLEPLRRVLQNLAAVLASYQSHNFRTRLSHSKIFGFPASDFPDLHSIAARRVLAPLLAILHCQGNFGISAPRVLQGP